VRAIQCLGMVVNVPNVRRLLIQRTSLDGGVQYQFVFAEAVWVNRWGFEVLKRGSGLG
jgi:hypothetical protein